MRERQRSSAPYALSIGFVFVSMCLKASCKRSVFQEEVETERSDQNPGFSVAVNSAFVENLTACALVRIPSSEVRDCGQT